MEWIRSLLSLSIFLVLLGFGILLGLDNSSLVRLRFAGWHSPELTVFTWLIGALIVGVALGALLSGLSRLSSGAARRLTGAGRDTDSPNNQLP